MSYLPRQVLWPDSDGHFPGEANYNLSYAETEIAQVEAGHVPVLGDTAIKERFQQFTALARELLTDFREVEHNFRSLDRRVRERITLWCMHHSLRTRQGETDSALAILTV